MRTRRSPRNQQILFAALFRPAAPPAPAPIKRTDAEIDAMWWIPKQSRRLLKADKSKA